MAAISALQNYGESSDSDGDSAELSEDATLHLKPITNEENAASTSTAISIMSAPFVAPTEDANTSRQIDPTAKEVLHNPKYEELYAPVLGPNNPFKTEQERAPKNALTGLVEPTNLSLFQFETQRRTFASYGYALDPSVSDANLTEPERFIGNSDEAKGKDGLTVFEATKKRPGDKRKRHRNADATDVEGYLGPWGKFVDEELVAKPSEEDQKKIDEYLSKKQRRKDHEVDEKPMEEKTKLHLEDPTDYLGRSWTHVPQDTGVNLKSEYPPEKCFLPKKLIHTWTGHTKGLSAIRWFPRYGHLLLSAGMDSKIKIWEVYNERRCIRTYLGHKQAVRDICFNNDGTQFLSAGYDRYIKLWDTETGACVSRFTNQKVPYCVRFNPEPEKHNFFVAGMSDKKIVCWDIRSGEIVQEYDRHLGAVNSITFVDQNRRFVSTSDDKSVRVWEWDVPVDFKYIADPSMHSMPTTALSPNEKWLACQSMDNQIVVFNVLNRMKYMRKKIFRGHMVAGYSCTIDFSPDMSYLISGDADGKLFIWDWKTTRLFNRFKAHHDVCIAALWHPHETSKVATAGWDGLIKFWD